MALRSIFAKVTADTTGFEAGMRRAAKSVTPFQQAMGGLKDVGKTLTLLRGGAALAGVSIAADRFSDFTAKLNEWDVAVRRGTKSWEDFGQEMRTSVPILGNIVKSLIELDKYTSPEKYGLGVGGNIGDKLAEEQRRNEDRLKAIQERNKPIEDALSSARKEFNKLNFGERDALVFELRVKGIDESKIKELRDLWEDIDELDRRNAGRDAAVRLLDSQRDNARNIFESMESRAKSLAESIKTPAMRFKEASDEVFKLLGSGAFGFGLDGVETANRLIEKFRKDIFPAINRTSAFGEVDLTRTFIGEGASPVKKQNVEDVRLKETNAILRDIRRQNSTGVARAA